MMPLDILMMSTHTVFIAVNTNTTEVHLCVQLHRIPIRFNRQKIKEVKSYSLLNNGPHTKQSESIKCVKGQANLGVFLPHIKMIRRQIEE